MGFTEPNVGRAQQAEISKEAELEAKAQNMSVNFETFSSFKKIIC